MSENTPSPLSNVITIDDDRIKSHLDRIVRGSVEETLNALLDAEADRRCSAQRYERSEARRDARAGHYERKSAYQGRRGAVEDPEASPADLHRVEDITEALWGMRVSPATVSDLNKKIYGAIEGPRNRHIALLASQQRERFLFELRFAF
jgi:putative transposase